MSSPNKNKKSKEKETTGKQPSITASISDAWISMRSGIIIISIVSIGMAVMTAWQAIPQKGWLEGSLLGLFFGILIWVVFLGMQLFYRVTGPKR